MSVFVRDEETGLYWTGSCLGPRENAKSLSPDEARTLVHGRQGLRIAPAGGPTSEQIASWSKRLNDHLDRFPALVDVRMSKSHVLAVISYLQLALRHPLAGNGRYHPTANLVREFKDSLIGTLAAGDADVELLLRRGDCPDYDI